MSQISFPYGKTVQTIDLPDDRLRGVLRSRMHAYRSAESEKALVAQALAQPVGTPRLRDMAAAAVRCGVKKTTRGRCPAGSLCRRCWPRFGPGIPTPKSPS